MVQTDGQLKTGRDVVIAALLGAEEYGFATAPLVVSGCVMMRVCHLDTCPVGVATQNPELRARFTGKPEFVVTFFEFLAEEVREHLAALGFRTLDEAIGHAELLDTGRGGRALEGHRAGPGPAVPRAGPARGRPAAPHHRRRTTAWTRPWTTDSSRVAGPALERGEPVRAQLPSPQRQPHRRHDARRTRSSSGTGGEGLPEGTIDLDLHRLGGQSFGAFVAPGITLRLEGDANDYVGKGLSGGRITVRPARDAASINDAAGRNVIAGNVIAYGATAGRIHIRGTVGERFCVRNSGATAVVEGVGDHACEYMTGGTVVILGEHGRNLAAGMSGGTAYVLDLQDRPRQPGDGRRSRPLDAEDRALLQQLVQDHFEETGSTVAEELLADWASHVGRFAKVMPRRLQARARPPGPPPRPRA